MIDYIKNRIKDMERPKYNVTGEPIRPGDMFLWFDEFRALFQCIIVKEHAPSDSWKQARKYTVKRRYIGDWMDPNTKPMLSIPKKHWFCEKRTYNASGINGGFERMITDSDFGTCQR